MTDSEQCDWSCDGSHDRTEGINPSQGQAVDFYLDPDPFRLRFTNLLIQGPESYIYISGDKRCQFSSGVALILEYDIPIIVQQVTGFS